MAPIPLVPDMAPMDIEALPARKSSEINPSGCNYRANNKALEHSSLTVQAENALSSCLIARFTRFERSATRDHALV
jgi:hypothetical protein